MVRDITERRRAEEALRESEARYRSVVEGSFHGILIKQGPRIEYASPACLRMFGYASSEEFVGRPWEIIVAPEDLATLWQRADACVRAEPVAPHPGWQGVRKDGTRIWIESMISRIWWHGQYAVLAFMVDITARKHLEEQLRQAQKMEAIGVLAGGVAHDFNNLLTVINGYSELLLDSSIDPDSRELVRQIHRAGERATALTRQLLTFSRKQVLAPQVLDLNELVREAEKMLRRLIGADIDLAISLERNLPRIKADPGQMEQVIMNLCINARDAMPNGGHLTIETQNVRLDRSYCEQHFNVKEGCYVLLAITDTGCGMDEATQTRIFEPFFTTKGMGQGTGLGLSTVHGIIQQSGGHLQVYSEPGRGSTFKVYLPTVTDSHEIKKAQPSSMQVRHGTETILLAEDDLGIRGLARIALQSYGYTVLEAADGQAGLQIAQSHPGVLHLLISDVVMPKMSGREMVEKLQPLRPNMKILFVSGYADDAIVRHGILESGVAFLHKPFTPTVLARKVREVLDG